MIEINNNVVYVKGAKNGAIYDFNTNKVFSINPEACHIISKIVNNEKEYLDIEKQYIELLKENKLISQSFDIKEYIPSPQNNTQLSLAWLEITQACNLRCLHCYEGNVHRQSENVLSLNKWKSIIDELNELQVKRVVIIGGEPCAYKNIKELLLYAAKYNFHTTLFTNATLMDNELMRIIIENDIKVKVSLYGHNAEIHDGITTKTGSFDKLVENIKYLTSNNVTVNIAVVAMKENQDYMNEIKDFIKSLGISYKGYDVIRNVFGGTQNEHTPNKGEIIKKAKYSRPSFSITKSKFDTSYSQNTCWHGKIAITETGQVIPCVFERSLFYGNVRNKSVKEIIDSDILKDNWFRNFSKIEVCKDCEYRFACKDCRPLGISRCGNISSKNPRCLYNPYSGEWSE